MYMRRVKEESLTTIYERYGKEEVISISIGEIKKATKDWTVTAEVVLKGGSKLCVFLNFNDITEKLEKFREEEAFEKQCRNCGATITNKGSKFCAQCGYKLSS